MGKQASENSEKKKKRGRAKSRDSGLPRRIAKAEMGLSVRSLTVRQERTAQKTSEENA